MNKVNLLRTNLRLFPLIYRYKEKFFGSEMGFAEELRNYGLSETEVQKDLAHERAHFEMAERLFANPTYAVASYFLINPGNDICYSPIISAERQEIFQSFVRMRETAHLTRQEIIRVLSAPEKLSEGDKQMIAFWRENGL